MASTVIFNASITFGNVTVPFNGSQTSGGDEFVYASGVATVTPAALDTGATASAEDILIANTGSVNLLVSLDGNTTYPIEIAPGMCNLITSAGIGSIYVATTSSTTGYKYFLIDA